jgi:tetratricopeptide (TPR) repeat protein
MRRFFGRALALVLVGFTAIAATGCLGSSTAVSTGVLSPISGSPAKSDELGQDQALQASLVYARSLDKAGNARGALEQYEKVLHINPNNLEASRRLAALYDDAGDFTKAEAEYRKVAKVRPRDSELFNDWGYSYFLRNNWSEAEAKLRLAIKLDPNNKRARCNLGLVLGQGQHKRYAEALQCFRDAGLEEADARCDLAFLYWTNGQLDEAKHECHVARQYNPTCARAKEMLTQLDQPAKPRRDEVASAPNAGRSLGDRGSWSASAKPMTVEERHARYPLPKGWAEVEHHQPTAPQSLPQDSPAPQPSVSLPSSDTKTTPPAPAPEASDGVMGTVTITE